MQDEQEIIDILLKGCMVKDDLKKLSRKELEDLLGIAILNLGSTKVLETLPVIDENMEELSRAQTTRMATEALLEHRLELLSAKKVTIN